MGKKRGRRTELADRKDCLKKIEEAVSNGACLFKACIQVGVDPKTYRRWKKDSVGDRRKDSKNVPANKLSDEEKERVLKIANSERFQDKPPAQIVPALADEGKYIASESTFYRCLKEEGMLVHRGKQKQGSKVNNPRELVSTGPNEVWSWDITYLKTNIKGV